MANVQPQFSEFNLKIRLDRFGHSQTLRDKRNIIRTRLRDRLPGVFEKYEEECPKFEFRDQGSYELGTGVIPLWGEYDIDQGIYFYTSVDTYPDPLTLKKRVYEALEGHTDDVCIRNSCVTVTYKDDGDGPYHVDLAVYIHADSTIDGVALLAKGKETTPRDKREWQSSDQEGLTRTLYAKFVSNDRSQWRRCVRYLKRWRAENFSSVGNSAPIGIALTIAAYKYLYPQYSDRTAWVPNDLAALRTVVSGMLGGFQYVTNEDTWETSRRLVVKLPVVPESDLLSKMTDKQMEDFEAKLNALLAALDEARDEVDTVNGCEILQKKFGDDFPVPERKATRVTLPPAIISSGNSG